MEQVHRKYVNDKGEWEVFFRYATPHVTEFKHERGPYKLEESADNAIKTYYMLFEDLYDHIW